MRDAFGMNCAGLERLARSGELDSGLQAAGRQTNRLQSYKIGQMVYPVKLKGRAWITADNYQIVHIESEMVRPMPEIKLLSEHQIVEYGRRPLREEEHLASGCRKRRDLFRLPQHRYYRAPQFFGRYMLFSVGTEEKTKEPVSAPTSQPTPARPS